MSNPFHILGMVRPGAPLDPSRHPYHEGLYVGVGGSVLAFEHFKAQLGSPDDVIADGRLVVATGPEGCGKTTLINRCAAWLRSGFNHERAQCVVLSLTDVARPSDSVTARTRVVIRAILDELEDRDLVTQAMSRDLLERADMQPDLFYRQLTRALRGAILVVLLPPAADLVAELELYAGLTRGSIVFFAESSYTESVRHQWPRIAAAARGPSPILCEVGPLDGDDAWRFVQSRLGQDREGYFPKLSEATIRQVVGARQWSVGQLQLLLHGIYAEISEKQFTVVSELTYNDITDFYFRRAAP